MNKRIKIACPHEVGGLGTMVTVSDHYPLNKTEIKELLTTAANNWNDAVTVSEIQVRLNQGIVGITCPRPVTGKVADKLVEMDALFMNKYMEGGKSDTVDKMYQIMTRK